MFSNNVLSDFLIQTWNLTVEMAPYLLLGFLVAGLLRAFFDEAWVKRHLGQAGLYQILKAVVIGIPLPLCSCGVIPVAAGIRRQGGQAGAVAAFTAATPQTGVDAIAASVGMLGWPFTVVRVLLAFVNGILSGLLVDRLARPASTSPAEGCCGHTSDPSGPSSCCGMEASDPPDTAQCNEPTSCCHVDPTAAKSSSCCEQESALTSQSRETGPNIRAGLHFGLFTLPRDLFSALIVGLLLAGVVSTLIPKDLLTAIPGGTYGTYLAMTLISLPLYVCSTGSIPMAFSFLAAGLSPGAVLIFLIAGPATNTATVTALWSLLGGRATVAYILSIVGTAWVAAYGLDASGLSLFVMDQLPHQHLEPNLFQQLSGIVLIGLLLTARFKKN